MVPDSVNRLQREYLFTQSLAYLPAGYFLFTIDVTSKQQIYKTFGLLFIVISFILLFFLLLSLYKQFFLIVIAPMESYFSSAMLNASIGALFITVLSHKDLSTFTFELWSVFIWTVLLLIYLFSLNIKNLKRISENFKRKNIFEGDFKSILYLSVFFAILGLVTLGFQLYNYCNPFIYLLISQGLLVIVILFDPKYKGTL